MRKLDGRAALLTTAILGALVAVVALVWSHPKVLLYVLLALIGILAYAALYLIVSAKLKRDEPPPPSSPKSQGPKSDSR
jgi:hypothetical protein